MDQTPHNLLADYVQNGSETAFRELVNRYVDLVHSVASRMTRGDVHLAEDITQTVFTDLARSARKLPADVMLGGWIHRHTCFVARNILRAERRRRDRENRSIEMEPVHDSSNDHLDEVAPELDEAINQLGALDRQAIVLRFFEQREFRAVGEALGCTEEAARKRVNRALQKLHLLLSLRGVALSVGSLGVVLSAHAVSAAPAGLAGTIAASALATASTVTGGVAWGLFQLMNTKLKTILAAGGVVVMGSVPVAMQQYALMAARAENAALRQHLERLAELEADNARLSATLSAMQATRGGTDAQETPEPDREVMKLRGKISSLQNAAARPRASMFNGLAQSPEILKMIREQKKDVMTSLYTDLVTELGLSKEQSSQLIELLADSLMTNIVDLAEVMQSGGGLAAMEPLLAREESRLDAALRELLGDAGQAEYHAYNRDMLNSMTAKQFTTLLTGDSRSKQAKANHLLELLRAESQQILVQNGLSPDFQLMPTMNFRNFVSEEEFERNLKLLDDLYNNVGTRASFLSREELLKWEKFREQSLNGNRSFIAMNRRLMQPQKP